MNHFHNPQKRKAQIQSLETIAVLLVFFMILAFGLIFYANAQRRSLLAEQDMENTHAAIQIAQLISFSPGLQCSNDNIVEDDCFDILKLQGFSNQHAQNQLFFYDIFKYSKISVEEVYPDSHTWDIYINQPPPAQDRGAESIEIPLLLKDASKSQYYFGVLHVKVYN